MQLEEDGDGSTRQSWMKTRVLRPMLHRERGGISQMKSLTKLRPFVDRNSFLLANIQVAVKWLYGVILVEDLVIKRA